MLADQQPSAALIDWAEQTGIVKKAQDRPWFYTTPPMMPGEAYQPKCKCNHIFLMRRFPCEDNNGYVYIGQCGYCERIVWTVLECAGK